MTDVDTLINELEELLSRFRGIKFTKEQSDKVELLYSAVLVPPIAFPKDHDER